MFEIDFENINYRLFLRTRRYLVYAGGGVVLAILLLLFVLIPQFQRVFVLYQDLNQSKKEIVKLRQKAIVLESIETNPIYQNQDRINRILPSKKAVFELLASLKFIADSGSVSLRDIDLNPGLLATESTKVAPKAPADRRQKIPGVEEIKIALSVEGTRGNINGFLTSISKIIPLTSVTKMKLQAARGQILGFDSSEFESEVELTAYYYNSSFVVSADSPLPELGDEELQVLSQLNTFLGPQFIIPKDVSSGGLIDLFGEDALQLEN
ncbi:MAG: hypothetical protein ABFQ62_01805 [Patescibacteria group bacterium]